MDCDVPGRKRGVFTYLTKITTILLNLYAVLKPNDGIMRYNFPLSLYAEFF